MDLLLEWLVAALRVALIWSAVSLLLGAGWSALFWKPRS